MTWTTYKEKVKSLSDQLVEIQRPIRILDAIKWPPNVEEEFRRSKFRELPKIDRAYYESQPLGYDPLEKISQLQQLADEIKSVLGPDDEIGQVMRDHCVEYQDVVRMLIARGTKQFYEYSRKLFGSPKDSYWDGQTTVNEISHSIYNALSVLDDKMLGSPLARDIAPDEVVRELNKRFDGYFTSDPVRAKISDGIIADATAGSDTVKVKDGLAFSTRDISILEVHEGWVHVGTTLNGQAQHICTFLGKGPPRTAPTQEGLAVMLEVLTFASYPRRARAINDRVLAIDKVEDGANVLDLLEFYRVEGYDEVDSLNYVTRVFRGGLVEGGAPFTKDIAYTLGFIENYNFIRAAMKAGKPEYIPFLFTGKLRATDVPLWYRKHQEGIVDAPKYVPQQFRDLNGLAVWVSFSNVFNMIDMEKVQEYFSGIFHGGK